MFSAVVVTLDEVAAFARTLADLPEDARLSASYVAEALREILGR